MRPKNHKTKYKTHRLGPFEDGDGKRYLLKWEVDHENTQYEQQVLDVYIEKHDINSRPFWAKKHSIRNDEALKLLEILECAKK